MKKAAARGASKATKPSRADTFKKLKQYIEQYVDYRIAEVRAELRAQPDQILRQVNERQAEGGLKRLQDDQARMKAMGLVDESGKRKTQGLPPELSGVERPDV